VRPAGITPDPVDAAFVATRLTTLVHELSTLIDGSMRVIGLARRSVVALEGNATLNEQRSKTRPPAICPEKLERQLETVDAAMRQMAELVRSSMIGMAEGGIAGVRMGFGGSSSLSEAVRHAAEVMAPFAEECCVRLDTQIAPELSEIAAGPIYAVIINGVRNAVESIQRIGDRYTGGCVVVRAWMEAGKSGRCVMITIEDDGEGLVRGGGRRAGQERSGASRADGSVFRLGFSTKPGGSGIGLSLCRDVVEQLGGTIELLARARDPHSGRGGAVLSICYPVPDAERLF
jgi:signal transduction histidine kinase